MEVVVDAAVVAIAATRTEAGTIDAMTGAMAREST